jgi:hypothetical protein
MSNTVDLPTRGKKPADGGRGLLAMEDPLVDLERLIGGIMGLGFDGVDSEDLRACYVLAMRARERLIQLRDLWESRVNWERAQTAG